MATTPNRRAIGAAPADAQAPATNEKKIDDVTAVDPVADPSPDPAPDNQIVPVDTESPDYKAGYQNAIDGVDAESNDYRQGYAAGLGSTGASAPSDAAPADAAPAAGKPATVQELSALAPDDNGFVVEQLRKGATMSQATASFCARLNSQLKTERDARAKAEAKAADDDRSPPPARLRTAGTESAAPADPKAIAAAEWKSNKDDCQSRFISEGVYTSFRKRQMASADSN